MKQALFAWFPALAGGILLGTVLADSSTKVMVFSAGVLLAGIIYWVKQHGALWIMVGALVCLGICIGFLRFHHQSLDTPYELPRYTDEVSITGVIDRIDGNRSGVIAIISPKKINNKDIQTKERLRISAPDYTNLRPHDTILATGQIEAPRPFVTESDRVFQYDEYLLNDRITALMRQSTIQIINEPKRWSLKRSLYSVRQSMIQTVQSFLPAPESSLAIGMLIGEQGNMGDTTEEAFRKTGLTHIVVLSGYNISLVIDAVTKALSFAPSSLGFMGSVLGVIVFAILVGGGSTVIRASIMAMLVLVARYIGRPHTAGRGLLYAAALMVLVNPRVLVYDLSFQLSFIATLGIIYGTPIIESIIPKYIQHKASFVTEIFSASTATYLFVLPLIVYAIGEISAVSLIANMAVLPLVPFSMATTAMMIGLAPLGASALVSGLPYATTHVIVQIVHVLASLPFSILKLPSPGAIGVVAMYCLLALGVYRFWRIKHQRQLKQTAFLQQTN